MSLFGFNWNNRNAPVPLDKNPYQDSYNNLSDSIGSVFADPAARADALQRAQAWQAAHDYANGTGQFGPTQQGSAAPLTVSDGGTALASSAPTGPTGTDYTSSPGPMDQIAAQAQGATTGGTSLMDTGSAPRATPAAPDPYPSAADLGLPPTRAKVAADALKLAAAGANPGLATGMLDWQNPASTDLATPRYWQDPNGGYHMMLNGHDQLLAQPPMVRELANYDGSQTVAAINPYADQPPQSNTAANGVAAASASIPTMAAPPGSRAARNNNPWNLRGGGQWRGMTGQDAQGFDQFDTAANGVRAAQINLANQQRLHGINTIAGLIARESPSSDGNDVSAYTAAVARQTGYDPNQKLDFTDPQVQNRVLQAIFNVEGGGTPQTAASVAQGTPQPPRTGDSQDGAPGARVLFQSQGFNASNGAMSDAVDRDAQKLNQTGTFDKTGMGKQSAAYAMAVRQRAAERVQQGLDGGSSAQTLAGAQMNFGANQSNIKEAQNDFYNTRNNVQRLDAQAQFVIDTLKGAGPTGSPLLNTPIQLWRKNGISDADEAKFRQAFGTFTDDYATIMGGGNSQLTDQKQREAQRRIDEAASQGTLSQIITQMQNEAHRAMEVKQSNLQNLSQSYNTQGIPGTAAQPPRTGRRQFVEGQVYQDAKGNKARYSGGQWVAVQ
jgi:hypothetical protein